MREKLTSRSNARVTMLVRLIKEDDVNLQVVYKRKKEYGGGGGSPQPTWLRHSLRHHTTTSHHSHKLSNSPYTRLPQAKEPREAKRKQKRTGKQSVVDLDEDDEDDEMASRRTITRWNNNEEILLAESWIEHSQDANIGKDQHDDIYWTMILSDFNSRTTAPSRTKNMVTEKWIRMHCDFQGFNGIYKHLNRKSGESDADLVENAKTAYIDRYGKKDADNLEELFDPDPRERSRGKTTSPE
ncbi:hypothetical protein Tco_1379657 [Tanacetum coccineum]